MSNPILDYIFVRKGGMRAKTPAEAFLTAYLITATANKKRFKDTNQADTKRGELAIKEFYNKKSSDENTKKIRKILESFKKKLKSELKNDDYLLSKSTKEFFKLAAIYSNSYRNLTDVALLSQYRNFDINSIKNEFRRYNSKHPNIIDKTLMKKIGDGDTTTIQLLKKKRDNEKLDREKQLNQFKNDAKECAKKLFDNKNFDDKKILLEKELFTGYKEYVDCLYKLQDRIYRIIVGKKEAVATKGFSWIYEKILGDIGEIKLEGKNGKYKLTKIAQGKTAEKYADTGAGNDKKEFHFRYKIYLGGPLQANAFSDAVYDNDINDKMKLAVLKHFGYDFTKQLGKGGYGTAYLDSKEAKNGIMRVIKVCIGTQNMVKTEWKGVNTAYKIFDKIKNPDSDTKKLREEFYKNESIVFNKNKAMGQISEITGYTTEARYERYWYCISTSEFRSGGDASSVLEEDIKLFNSNKKALWIELQAFAKDILTGLSIFHKQGTAHLEPVFINDKVKYGYEK